MHEVGGNGLSYPSHLLFREAFLSKILYEKRIRYASWGERGDVGAKGIGVDNDFTLSATHLFQE